MSDWELEVENELRSVDDLLERLQAEAVASELKSLTDFGELQAGAGPFHTGEPMKAPEKRVRWRKRDSNGNEVYQRPRSTRNLSKHDGHRSKPPNDDIPSHASNETNGGVAIAPEPLETLLLDLQYSLSSDGSDAEQEAAAPTSSLLASSDWSTRNSLFSERWREERPRLVNSMLAQENVASYICQQCGFNPAVIQCRDCLPHAFFCAESDIRVHTRYVLHNRDALISGFFHPLAPTTCVNNQHLSQCVRSLPVALPYQICGCPPEALKVRTGKMVTLITMNGRYNPNLPELTCEKCQSVCTTGVNNLLKSGYWPATINFSTIYTVDVFSSFQEMKMAAPGLSCQAFLKMLDQRTVRFGRTGKISADSFHKSFMEWFAVCYEVDKICKEDNFICPACTPHMLAVCGWKPTEEQALFEGVFISKDQDVASFVDYIHQRTNHVSGKGVCGGEWAAGREIAHKSNSKVDEEGLELAVCRHGMLLSALNIYRGEIFAYPLFLQKQLASSRGNITFFCTDITCKYWPYLQRVCKDCPELQHLPNMRPFLSVLHAKAHDLKCEVKWSGAYQENAGSTLGEEVEQCNAFLSRIAVTTKHMSKAGRAYMSLNWNKQKFQNMASSLTQRYQKTCKTLQSQLENLESLKAHLAVAESQLEDWVNDVKEWAEATTANQGATPQSLCSKIEALVASIKTRSQRLYKQTDSNKGRHRIRRKIRKEKRTLAALVEQYNNLVPSKLTVCLNAVFHQETPWPWQLPCSDSVDLRTKKMVFDNIMAVRRLNKEKQILVREMDQHWKFFNSSCSHPEGAVIPPGF